MKEVAKKVGQVVVHQAQRSVGVWTMTGIVLFFGFAIWKAYIHPPKTQQQVIKAEKGSTINVQQKNDEKSWLRPYTRAFIRKPNVFNQSDFEIGFEAGVEF